jgi:predicted acyl esterase
MVPGRVGVAKDRLPGFEKFEAPDPAEWTARGYAIVNPDARGAYDSEGNLLSVLRTVSIARSTLTASSQPLCTQEAQDGYDLVEALATMPWYNGNVAFVGCSWLGIAQWFIAAERPPHLKCTAPLEAAADLYRDILCRGGIPQTAFRDFLSGKLYGMEKLRLQGFHAYLTPLAL